MSQQMPPQGNPNQPYPPQASAIPQHARERLNIMRGDATHRGLFTSDLSVSEFLLAREAGFEPVGLVVGSSIYHIGLQMANWGQNQELGVLTQVMYNARELAMSRMEEEAHTLGADGIIGVRLEISMREWGEALAEFVAVGTAVRARDGRSYRNAKGKPFTSDLSGQDFWTLLKAGYMPVGMVMGTCVYHIAHQTMNQWFKQVGRNSEMANFTQGLYDARELAMERMQAEAMQLQAQGIIGARVNEASHTWGSHIIEFFSVGTAVVSTSAEHVIATPSLTLPLNS